jgi:hypothetical protein
MRQLITPNPDIDCKPGWCLQYVRQTFGLPAKYGSATEAWERSDTKHYAQDFPVNCWVPVWFSLETEPAGHVALLAPDGSVYSTSDLGNKPHHHPTLDHLMSYYAYYGMPLTYRGWTEDVASYPVVASDAINVESTTTEQGLFMALTEQQQADIYWELCSPEGRQARVDRILDAPIDLIDPTGKTTNVTGTTTLRTKIKYMAHNDEQLRLDIAAVAGKLA